MPKYDVRLPVTGYVEICDVQAESEKAAIEKALNEEWTVEQLQEVEAHKIIAQGNVFRGSLNEAEAMYVGDDEEEAT